MMVRSITLLTGLFFLVGAQKAWADDKIVLGKLYPITERDALEEIEARVATTPFDKKVFGEEKDWAALRSPILPEAEKDASRRVVPFYSLGFDIPDRDGNVLYPKGYTFNPLEYVRLPQRLIVVNQAQLAWAFEQHEAGDMILLSGGNALDAMRTHNRPIFKLEEQIKERLDLRFVPSVIKQEGTAFIVNEYILKREKGDD